MHSVYKPNSSIWPRDRTLLSATTLGESGPGSNGNEGVLRIPSRSIITGASPSDGLVSYPGHSFWGCLTPLQRCSCPVGWGYRYSTVPDSRQVASSTRKKDTQNFAQIACDRHSFHMGLQNTPTQSLQRGKTPPTSVLDMTLNNLMVRLQ